MKTMDHGVLDDNSTVYIYIYIRFLPRIRLKLCYSYWNTLMLISSRDCRVFLRVQMPKLITPAVTMKRGNRTLQVIHSIDDIWQLAKGRRGYHLISPKITADRLEKRDKFDCKIGARPFFLLESSIGKKKKKKRQKELIGDRFSRGVTVGNHSIGPIRRAPI